MPESLWQDFEAFYRAPEALSWWLITASAGAGKSRTALEFCKALKTGRVVFFHAGKFRASEVEPIAGEDYSVWKAGFLDLANTPFSVWTTWRPRRHTLLVIDNVARHYNARLGEKADGENAQHNRHNIVEIIECLNARAAAGEFEQFRVRLLLLERDDKTPGADKWRLDWFEKLPREAPCCFRAQPTPLPSVPPEGLLAIAGDMRADIRRNKPEAPYVVPGDFLARLRALDGELRPLYAMLLVAYAAENNRPEATRNEMLDFILREEYENVLRPAGLKGTPQALRALVVSTLTGGKVGACKLDSAHPLWHSGLGFAADDGEGAGGEGGDSDKTLFRLHPVEPAILGEYLVLHGVRREDIFSSECIGDGNMGTLIHKAWEVFPAEVFDFFDRCGQDFASSPEWIAIRFLNESLAGASAQVKLWYMRGAANLVARLDAKGIDTARAVLAEMDRLGEAGLFRRERARAVLGLIRICAEAGLPDEAHMLFMGMEAFGESKEIRLLRIEAAGHVIDGLSKMGELVRARLLYESMLAFETAEAIQPIRAAALATMMNGYGKAGDLAEARLLFDDMAGCGACAAVRTQRAQAAVGLIVLYARAGLLGEACTVFEDMQAFGDEAEIRELHHRAYRFLQFFTDKEPAKHTKKQDSVSAAG
jgi:pentatricopeptide repeat protein